jgi:hypothetical protein
MFASHFVAAVRHGDLRVVVADVSSNLLSNFLKTWGSVLIGGMLIDRLPFFSNCLGLWCHFRPRYPRISSECWREGRPSRWRFCRGTVEKLS